MPCHIVEIVGKTVGGKPSAVNLLVHEVVAFLLRPAVHSSALLLDFQHGKTEAVVNAEIAPPQNRHERFQDMHEQSVVAPAETEVVVKRHEPLEQPARKRVLDCIERKRKPLLARGHDMQDFAKVARVRTPALRPLFVGEHLDERKVVHGRGVTAHFEPRIEKVVLLVGLPRALFHLFEFEVVAALLAHFRNRHDAEFKTAAVRIVFNHLLAEPQRVEVENVRVSAFRNAFGKEIRPPHRKVARRGNFVVLAHGIVGHDKTALDDIHEIGERVSFQHLEQSADFERVVELPAVARYIVAVELCVGVAVPSVAVALQRHPLFHGGEVMHGAVLHTRAQLVLEGNPRKIRQFHVRVTQYLERPLSEHYFLRKHHIRYHRGLLSAHTPASHRHDGKLVDEPAVARLEMTEPHKRNPLSETVEKHPQERRGAPPREVGEYNLQVRNEFARLRVKRAEIERHGKEEIVRERAHRNAGEVEVENPYRNPHYDNPPVLAEKRRILRHRPFQRLICHRRNTLENGKRQGVLVVLRVVRGIDRPHRNGEEQNTRQNDCNHLTETTRDNTRVGAPFPEIFAVEKQGAKRLRRSNETVEIEGQKQAQIHNGRGLRDCRHNGMFDIEYFAEIELYRHE